MKIVTVVGARPQFIKASVVSRELRSFLCDVEEILLHTGQHFSANMSMLFFQQLGIPEPDYQLNIGGGTHGENTGRMIEKIEGVLYEEEPVCLLVYGDTDSTLAGALAAAKIGVPVAHVEAGLRSFNRKMPEEINRIVTDHLSDYLFVPTEQARRNLEREGLSRDAFLVGDVMRDAAIYYRSKSIKPAWFDSKQIEQGLYVLCTIHRQENTDDKDRIRAIFEGLGCSGFPVVLPLHPRTRKIVEESDIIIAKNIHVVDPVGYLEMVWLEGNAAVIATDSGGVQKEAYFYKVPCVTIRTETEWGELVESGWNRLVSPNDSLAIADSLKSAIAGKGAAVDLYGVGNAGELIARELVGRLKSRYCDR